MSSGENYIRQIQDAKNGATDSFDYKQQVEAIDQQRRTAAIQRASGCLIGECQANGFTSGTPSACPVEDCGATFNKNALTVENQATCESPTYKPQPKYQY